MLAKGFKLGSKLDTPVQKLERRMTANTPFSLPEQKGLKRLLCRLLGLETGCVEVLPAAEPSRRLQVLFSGCEPPKRQPPRSEEHTSELQSREKLVCRL